jgi:hypothetical protein
MKKLLLFVILLYAFASQAQTGYAVIAAEDVNFRKSPETTSEVIRTVKLGTLAKILEGPVLKSNNKKWYKIQIGTQVGWMSADFVFELNPLSSITPDVVIAWEYIPFIASSKEDETKNFLVVVEGQELSLNSKTYPIRISATAKSKFPNLTFYRDKYLSMPDFMYAKILYCDFSYDEPIPLIYSVDSGASLIYVFSLISKLNEGVYEADPKFFNEVFRGD